MSDAQSLEEAWEIIRMRLDVLVSTSNSRARMVDAARALALAAFEMGVYTKTACGHTWNDEDAERRRIEALGK